MKRALSRHVGCGLESQALRWEECAAGDGGGMTQWGVLAAILAGARHRAKGTSTPRHISSCGPPAAHISYLKPEQICWEHKPAVPLENSDKADAKAQPRGGGLGAGLG